MNLTSTQAKTHVRRTDAQLLAAHEAKAAALRIKLATRELASTPEGLKLVRALRYLTYVRAHYPHEHVAKAAGTALDTLVRAINRINNDLPLEESSL